MRSVGAGEGSGGGIAVPGRDRVKSRFEGLFLRVELIEVLGGVIGVTVGTVGATDIVFAFGRV